MRRMRLVKSDCCFVPVTDVTAAGLFQVERSLAIHGKVPRSRHPYIQ
jgi:hypothetical protein